ncbi:MAG: hypothetical protein HY921_12670 [Elusimicrobia bacterium]|nr:hypothetical protein [Elusimicrobiota bacterium]
MSQNEFSQAERLRTRISQLEARVKSLELQISAANQGDCRGRLAAELNLEVRRN